MNKYIYTFFAILLSATLCPVGLQSQVTVGADVEPESYSVLQLEGTAGGLRLPQLLTDERDNLPVNPNDAGVMIYNRTSDRIEYWDGANWLAVGDTLKIYNGIHQDGTDIKLGGKLTESTTIDINDNGLSFATGTGSYSIGDTLFVVGSNVVSMKPTKFTANRDFITVSEEEMNIALDNTLQSAVSVKSGDTNLRVGRVNDTYRNVSITPELQYKDGNEAADRPLVSKTSGDAYWGELKPASVIKTGTIKPVGTAINTGGTNYEPSVSDTLTLEAGKWLILAKFSTYTSSSDRLLSWGNVMMLEGSVGVVKSATGYNPDTNGIALVQVVYFLNTSEEVKVYIRAGTQNSNTSIVAGYGPSRFDAILIDKPLE